jgi:hypothetical protein
MGTADPTKPIKLNGAFFTLCAILRCVVASAVEAEHGALFLNCKKAKKFRLTLEEMGHPQPPTPIHCNNLTAIGITNNNIKQQQSRSMEMRFFWVADAVEQGKFDIKSTLGRKILQTTRVNTTLMLITRQSILGTSMNLLLSMNSHELASQAL